MIDRDEALAQAEWLITEYQRCIAHQREVVANAAQAGRDTKVAEATPCAFESSLRAFERHRQHVLTWEKIGNGK
jgi:hypothetical protein